MASAARGAEEEVFETPDFAEDDLEQTAAGKDSGLSKKANKVKSTAYLYAAPPVARTQNKRREAGGNHRLGTKSCHRSMQQYLRHASGNCGCLFRGTC